MLKIYAYSGCGTCRKALQWLDQKKIPYQTVAIRETPPTVDELRQALKDGIALKGLFNTCGGDYKEMGLKDKLGGLPQDEALSLLATKGNLVKRPFVLGASRVLVGFKEADWEAVLPAA